MFPSMGATIGTSIINSTQPEIVSEGVVEGDIIYEDVPGELSMLDAKGADCCGGAACVQCCLIPCPVISLDNTELFAGVQGFTGPTNRGETGSFGFHEGFNWGFPFPCTAGAIGAQFGLRATQANLSYAEFTDSMRSQLFLTGGLFRRVDWGLQGGLVFDYLSEDWYANYDVVQLRGEISWVFPCQHELGFWFNTGTSTDTNTATFSGGQAAAVETWEPTDIYAFYYRRRFESMPGTYARVFAGFSGQSDGLVGGDVDLQLGPNFALRTGFTYLVPNEASGSSGRGHEQESWNLGITLVWYPGCRSICPDYHRPLLNVADNGSFMVDRRPGQ
jgi:hypothetical protein